MSYQIVSNINRNILLLIIFSCFFSRGSAQFRNTVDINPSSTYFSDQVNDFYRLHPRSLVTSNFYRESDYSIMLPAANMNYSPLFCRIEDKINEGNKIKCLFRLGSVSYVNFLEQKGDHQRLMLEQIR